MMCSISIGRTMISLAFTLAMLVTSEASSCDWSSGDGQLRPVIMSGSLFAVDALSLVDCQYVCLGVTSFLCAAVNYQPITRTCQLLAENDQTATIDTSSGGRYSIRPACAGLWQPWTAIKGNYLHQGVTKYTLNAANLRHCMSDCLETTTGADCRAVVKSKTTNTCQIVDKRSGDEGVTPEVSGQFQFFDRPSWYLDSSPGVTNSPILYQRDTGEGSSVQLYINYTILVDGYLVAWQYYASRIINACESYATIWRHDSQSSTYNRVTETKISPTGTEGVKFQFVQQTTAVVKAGDFIGLYVNESGCGGHVIGYRNGGGQVVDYYGNDRQNRPSSISSSISDELQTVSRSASVRAYIAGFIVLESAPTIIHTSPPSHGSIKVKWQQPTEYQTGSGYVKIDCSTDSNFQSSVDCQPNTVFVEEEGATLSLPDIRQPYYARVYIVRHYQEQELVQNPDDRYYLINGGDPFCSDRGRLTVAEIVFTQMMTADSQVSVEISIPSIASDSCVQSVNISYGTGSLLDQDKAQSWTFTKGLGETFTLTIELLLFDGHKALVWNKGYTVGSDDLSTLPQPGSSSTTNIMTPTTTTSTTTTPTTTTSTTTTPTTTTSTTTTPTTTTSTTTTPTTTTSTTTTSTTTTSTTTTPTTTTSTTTTHTTTTSATTTPKIATGTTTTPTTATQHTTITATTIPGSSSMSIKDTTTIPSVTTATTSSPTGTLPSVPETSRRTSSTITSQGTDGTINNGEVGSNSSELTLPAAIIIAVVIVVIVLVIFLAIFLWRRKQTEPTYTYTQGNSERRKGDKLPSSDKIPNDKWRSSMELRSRDSQTTIESLNYEEPVPTNIAPSPSIYVEMDGGNKEARNSTTSDISIYEPVNIRPESVIIAENAGYFEANECDLKDS